jgi:hypothetical protein
MTKATESLGYAREVLPPSPRGKRVIAGAVGVVLLGTIAWWGVERVKLLILQRQCSRMPNTNLRVYSNRDGAAPAPEYVAAFTTRAFDETISRGVVYCGELRFRGKSHIVVIFKTEPFTLQFRVCEVSTLVDGPKPIRAGAVRLFQPLPGSRGTPVETDHIIYQASRDPNDESGVIIPITVRARATVIRVTTEADGDLQFYLGDGLIPKLKR